MRNINSMVVNKMLLKDFSFPTPEENLLYDELLLDLAERGEADEVLRFWEAREPFVVLGRTGKVEDDVHIDHCLKDRVPILRRSSGGGTVLQGKGCLNYTLILCKDRDPRLQKISSSYQYILEKVAAALKTLHISTMFQPPSDLATGPEQKKFSGNAQKRGRQNILHHGTILYDFPLKLMGRYLKIPAVAPTYRRGRSHEDFLTNISLNPAAFGKAIAHCFAVDREEYHLNAREKAGLMSLLTTRDIRLEPVHNS